MYICSNDNELKHSIMKTISNEILNTLPVKMLIQTIRIMWDTKAEKENFVDRINWLDGMNPDSEETLNIMFKNFAEGNENRKTFAKRLAKI